MNFVCISAQSNPQYIFSMKLFMIRFDIQVPPEQFDSTDLLNDVAPALRDSNRPTTNAAATAASNFYPS